MAIESPYPIHNGATTLPEWVVRARSVTRESSGTDLAPPFPPESWNTRSFIGNGYEQNVYTFPQGPLQGYVVKESRYKIPFEYRLPAYLAGGPGFDSFLTWEEVAAIKQHNHTIMKGVFGDTILDTQYLYGYASDGSRKHTTYCIQECVEGNMLSELDIDETQELYTDPHLRKQMLSLLWGSKKALDIFGAPPDLGSGSNVMLSDNRDVLLIDPSFPSLASGIIRSNLSPLLSTLFYVQWIDPSLKMMEDVERSLNPTPEEIEAFNEQFDVSTETHAQNLESLYEIRNGLTIWTTIRDTIQTRLHDR